MIAEAKKIDTKDIQEIKGDNISDVNVPMTVEEFELWLLEQPELADKRFEFVEGRMIEKEGMKQNEVFILKFLSRLFVKTTAYELGGELIGETDSYINNKRKRIPDISFLTVEQIEAARKNEKQTSIFAIEILSPNEILQDIEEKIQDYFDAGTKLVWYISPKQEQIYTYTSPTEVKILKGEDVCSATPVLSDFSFSVKDMFL